MGATTAKQTKYPSLSSDGGWHTDGTVMVNQYTQTKQRRLRAKTVKSGHDKHYKKKGLAVNRGGKKTRTLTKKYEYKKRNQGIEKETSERERKKITRKKIK